MGAKNRKSSKKKLARSEFLASVYSLSSLGIVDSFNKMRKICVDKSDDYLVDKSILSGLIYNFKIEANSNDRSERDIQKAAKLLNAQLDKMRKKRQQ